MSTLVQLGSKPVFKPLMTPYYWPVLELPTGGCAPEPTYHVNSYNLFCLKTRLLPRLQRLLGQLVDVIFPSLRVGDKMIITVEPQRAGQAIPLTLAQDKRIRDDINDIVNTNSQYCLLLPTDSVISTMNGLAIPASWTNRILRFLVVAPTYNPFVNDEGLHVQLLPQPGADGADGPVDPWLVTDASTYTKLLWQNSDYLSKYDDTYRDILNQLQMMYGAGYVYINDLDPAVEAAWELEAVDTTRQLFRPRWSDSRIAPNPVEFIQEQLRVFDGSDSVVLRRQRLLEVPV